MEFKFLKQSRGAEKSKAIRRVYLGHSEDQCGQTCPGIPEQNINRKTTVLVSGRQETVA